MSADLVACRIDRLNEIFQTTGSTVGNICMWDMGDFNQMPVIGTDLVRALIKLYDEPLNADFAPHTPLYNGAKFFESMRQVVLEGNYRSGGCRIMNDILQGIRNWTTRDKEKGKYTDYIKKYDPH